MYIMFVSEFLPPLPHIWPCLWTASCNHWEQKTGPLFWFSSDSPPAGPRATLGSWDPSSPWHPPSSGVSGLGQPRGRCCDCRRWCGWRQGVGRNLWTPPSTRPCCILHTAAWRTARRRCWHSLSSPRDWTELATRKTQCWECHYLLQTPDTKCVTNYTFVTLLRIHSPWWAGSSPSEYNWSSMRSMAGSSAPCSVWHPLPPLFCILFCQHKHNWAWFWSCVWQFPIFWQ